jgi:hypothetical protein
MLARELIEEQSRRTRVSNSIGKAVLEHRVKTWRRSIVSCADDS